MLIYNRGLGDPDNKIKVKISRINQLTLKYKR